MSEFKYSKFETDAEVFDGYTRKCLVQAIQKANGEGMLAYCAAIGTDKCPIMFTADSHLMRRVAERLLISYASVIVQQIIEVVENNEKLGDMLLEAADTAYENKAQHGVVAIWVERSDLFLYLHSYPDRIHIATVVTDKEVYFVNGKSDAICWLNKDGILINGIKNIPKFSPSAKAKHKSTI